MCCGGNRAAARAAAVAAGHGSAPAPSAASATSVMTEIMFEYAGRESASITGPVSGRVYRFTGPGDRVRVDARDRPGLASMSVLRWVR